MSTSETGFWLTDALSNLTNGAVGYINNRLSHESEYDELMLYRARIEAGAYPPGYTGTYAPTPAAAAGTQITPVMIFGGIAVLGLLIWAAKS